VGQTVLSAGLVADKTVCPTAAITRSPESFSGYSPVARDET